jgi:CO/xanthine dehydrogenase Mo-binding subunit
MTETDNAAATFIRPDGKEKVTGAGHYTADLTFTGMAHAKFRFADHPHARIRRIDTTRARARPGVVAVVTQEDLPDVRFGGLVRDRTLFAKDVVRFEGEIVAGVVALSDEIATEAASMIEVDYEPLPVITDFLAAMEPFTGGVRGTDTRRDIGGRLPITRTDGTERWVAHWDGPKHARDSGVAVLVVPDGMRGFVAG